LNEFAPGDSGDDRTYEYEVYQCNPDDEFDWIGGPLYKTDRMDKAHGIAYELWKKHPDKAFMIWQERSQGSRGGYGIKDDEQGVAEGTGSSIERILAAHPEAVENFKQGGDLDYDLESDLWEYYFNNGEIRNYDADASEFISQRLADELGLSEGLDANQKRVGQLGPTEKVKNNNIGKLVGANESQLDEISQELAVKTLGKRRAHGMDGWGDDEAHRKADATEKRVEKKFGKDAVAAADKITDKELYGDRKMKENFINTVDQAVVSEEDEMAESILSAIKKVGKKAFDKVAPGDEELLKQLDKDAHGGKLPNRYNSDAESAKKYPADSWKVKVDESSDELARILTIMNHRR
jgi:hypothetical protein